MLLSVEFHLVVFKPKGSYTAFINYVLELAAGVCDVENCESQHNIDYAHLVTVYPFLGHVQMGIHFTMSP